MNVHLPAPRRPWAARLVNLAVVIVVLALAAATFVLSYTGVHAIALQAGVSARFARLYPATFDAALVIACVAAVALRDARWWARWYAWLAIILVVAVVGTADAVHAMNVVLPHRRMEGVVAAAPWVLALLGFSLMLTILRHSRTQHAAAVAAPDSPRAARRAAKRGTDQDAQSPAIPIEPTAELARPAASAPDLPAAQPPGTEPGQFTLAAGPLSAGEEHPPTLVIPALTEAASTIPAAAHKPPAADDADLKATPVTEAESPEIEAAPAAVATPAAAATTEAVAPPPEVATPPGAAAPSAAAETAPTMPPADTALAHAVGPETAATQAVSAEQTPAEATPALAGPAQAGGAAADRAGVAPREPALVPDAAGTGEPTLAVDDIPSEADRRAADSIWMAQHEPAATAGEPVMGAGDVAGSHDYWDREQENSLDEQSYPPAAVIDEDAPPFATAPFATVPRLKRVRATPTPPGEDDE